MNIQKECQKLGVVCVAFVLGVVCVVPVLPHCAEQAAIAGCVVPVLPHCAEQAAIAGCVVGEVMVDSS